MPSEASKRKHGGPEFGVPPGKRGKQQPSDAALSYQWLSPQEAVLQRPDMWVGAVDPVSGDGFLLNSDMKRAKCQWHLSPIFLKIFDEAIVNSLDASTRDSELRKISVVFCKEDASITVQNDGSGVPVQFFVKDGVQTDRLIPEVIFTELSAGSNFDDTQTRLLGGRNGVGISCTNIWSTLFEVDISDGKMSFQQVFKNNLTERSSPSVKAAPGKSGQVRIRFVPDYERMELNWKENAQLLEDLLRTRTAEVAVCARLGVTVTFNNQKLPSKLSKFAEDLFGTDEGISESFGRSEGGPGAEVIVGPRKDAVSFCAFVNGIRCDGGSLASHIFEKIHKVVCSVASKQKISSPIRLQTVKDHLSVLVIARIDKPRFTSQSKEALSTQVKNFGFSIEFSDRFLAKLAKMSAVEALIRHEVEHELAKDMKKVAPSKKLSDVNIDKYDPALDCRKVPAQCTLILTEGDSAKALATAGLSVVGRERFGVYPLRGKVLNVRNKPLKTSIANKEIAALLKILNISPGGSPDHLRYGRVAIFTDQDSDGAHIAGLLLNAIQYFFPEILKVRPDFVCRIVTPLIKATPKRGNGEVQAFFSVQSFNAWGGVVDLGQYSLKYYKGLGTSTTKDAKEIFRKLQDHTIGFSWDPAADARLVAFFDEKHANERKRILTEDYSTDLTIDFGASQMTVTDFLQKDLIHYSMYSNFRGIASAIDGLTPCRRKVISYFLSSKGTAEIKVAQAAAGTAMKTMYLHGENSLVESIVGLAQEHVGTNNVALLVPIGQFGSRLDPPSTHAAARYIYTKPSNITRAIFPKADDDVLEHRWEEGEMIEPKHFCGVIPLILVNGASGIGTGFSSSVPCHSLPSVVEACRSIISGKPMPLLVPYYEDFVGSVEATAKGVETRGIFRRTGPSSLEITELPVGRWTDVFLTDLKEAGEKAKLPVNSIVNRSTDASVCIELHFASPIEGVEDEVIVKALKLCESVPNTFMWLHDANYKLRLFEKYEDIVLEHSKERLRLYYARKEYTLRRLERELELAQGRATFIELVVTDAVKLKGKKRSVLEEELKEHGLPPLRSGSSEEASYDYALGMQFSACTEEYISKLRDSAEGLAKQLEALRKKTPEAMWSEELDELLVAHAEYLRMRKDRCARDEDEGELDRKAACPRPRAKPKAKARGGRG